MTRTRPVFIGHEIYRRSSYGPWHPLRVPRVSTVMDMVRALDWVDPDQYRVSPRARPQALSLWHDPEYLTALETAERDGKVSDAVRDRFHLGTASNPVFSEMFRRPATGAGGAMLAAAILRDPGVVHCPGCGTHHGMPDRANGFCFLNDLVLGMLAMKGHGQRRIAYIDIDAHHPDGVEHAFAEDPDVLMISVHEENRWPRTGALEDRGQGNLFNLPVPRGLNDDEFALIAESLILPQVARFRPDVIVLQCGADAVTEDPLSRMALSNNAHIRLLHALRPMCDRLLVTGGGGYNPWSVGRLWTRLWAALNDIDDTGEMAPAGQKVLQDLRWFSPQGKPLSPEAAWLTTLVDPARGGPIRDEVRRRLAQLSGAMV